MEFRGKKRLAGKQPTSGSPFPDWDLQPASLRAVLLYVTDNSPFG